VNEQTKMDQQEKVKLTPPRKGPSGARWERTKHSKTSRPEKCSYLEKMPLPTSDRKGKPTLVRYQQGRRVTKSGVLEAWRSGNNCAVET